MLCFMAVAAVLGLLRLNLEVAASGVAAVAAAVTLLLRQDHPRLVATAAQAAQLARLEPNPAAAVVEVQPHQALARLAA
jgi:hypothetical protein